MQNVAVNECNRDFSPRQVGSPMPCADRHHCSEPNGSVGPALERLVVLFAVVVSLRETRSEKAQRLGHPARPSLRLAVRDQRLRSRQLGAAQHISNPTRFLSIWFSGGRRSAIAGWRKSRRGLRSPLDRTQEPGGLRGECANLEGWHARARRFKAVVCRAEGPS